MAEYEIFISFLRHAYFKVDNITHDAFKLTENASDCGESEGSNFI